MDISDSSEETAETSSIAESQKITETSAIAESLENTESPSIAESQKITETSSIAESLENTESPEISETSNTKEDKQEESANIQDSSEGESVIETEEEALQDETDAELRAAAGDIAGDTYTENGSNITWRIDAAGNLTAEGTCGEGFLSRAPWSKYSSSIITAKLKISGVTDASDMFHRNDTKYENLTRVDLSEFDTSNVTRMSSMFGGCSSLTTLILGNFNTSKVTNMSGMFSGCSSLTTLDLSSFNTSKVSDMSKMFSGCPSLTSLNLSKFDTSKVSDMSNMFGGCKSLTTLNLSSFNTSNVTNMSEMFKNCSKLSGLDLKNFNTSNVTDMSSMFFGCKNLTTLNLSSNFNTSKVTKMNNSASFTYGASNGMFEGCESLTTLDLSSFDTSQITDMGGMFRDCKSLTGLNLSSFNTSNVTNMFCMFQNCEKLTSLDLSNFDTSKVTDMSSKDSYGNPSGMFSGCRKLTTLNLSDKFNTSNVTNMAAMFEDCSSLTTLDLKSFNTSNVTNMKQMFNRCGKLTTLDLSSFNTSKVTDMNNMFCDCAALTGLDVSSFDTSGVTGMSNMFENCSKLVTLDLKNFDMSKVTSSFYMFDDCSSLTTIHTPYNVKREVSVQTSWSYTWHTKTGQTSCLPQNLPDSTLMRRAKDMEAKITKTSYTVGEEINMDDLTVTYYELDENLDDVPKTLKASEYTTNINEINKTTPGEKTLVVTYIKDGRTFVARVKLYFTADKIIENRTITLPANMILTPDAGMANTLVKTGDNWTLKIGADTTQCKFTLSAAEGYILPDKIQYKIGVDTQNREWAAANGVYNISLPVKDITGNIEIVTKPKYKLVLYGGSYFTIQAISVSDGKYFLNNIFLSILGEYLPVDADGDVYFLLTSKDNRVLKEIKIKDNPESLRPVKDITLEGASTDGTRSNIYKLTAAQVAAKPIIEVTIDTVDIKWTGDNVKSIANLKINNTAECDKIFQDTDVTVDMSASAGITFTASPPYNKKFGVTVNPYDILTFKAIAAPGYAVKSITIKGAGEKVRQFYPDTNGIYRISAPDMTFLTESGNVTLTVNTALDYKQNYSIRPIIIGPKDAVKLAFKAGNEELAYDEANKCYMLTDAQKNALTNSKITLEATINEGFAGSYEAANVTVKSKNSLIKAAKNDDASDASKSVYDLTLGRVVKGSLYDIEVTLGGKALTNSRNVTVNQNVKTDPHIRGYVIKNTMIEKDQKAPEVTQDQTNPDKYTVNSGTKDLIFTVDVIGPYRPVIMLSDTSEEPAESKRPVVELEYFTKTNPSGSGATKKVTYTYAVAAASLADNNTITITEQNIEHNLRINGLTGGAEFNRQLVDVTVKVDNVTIEPEGGPETADAESGDADYVAYKVAEEAKVEITIKQKENASLKSVIAILPYQFKETAKSVSRGESKFTYTVTPLANTVIDGVYTDRADAVVNVTAVPAYKPYFEEKGAGADAAFAELEPKTGIYSIAYDGVYRASIDCGPVKGDGSYEKQRITDVFFYNSQKRYLFNIGISHEFITFAADKKSITFDMSQRGKNNPVKDGEQVFLELRSGRSVIGTYKLKISRAINPANIKINNKKAITQTEDTVVATYPLNVGTGEDASRLREEYEAVTSDTSVATASITADGKLSIATNTLKEFDKDSKGRDTTYKKVYVWLQEKAADAADTDSSNTPAQYGKVTLTVNKILDSTKTAAPIVALAAANDISLTLNLTAKNIAVPATGKIWYKIESTAKAEKNDDLTDDTLEKGTKTVYVEKTADTQQYILNLAKTGINTGKGRVRAYEVKTTLVYAKGDINPNDGGATDISRQSKTFIKQPFRTIAPAYEAALKFTRVRTDKSTVYTGQSDIAIATAQFSKTTIQEYQKLQPTNTLEIKNSKGEDVTDELKSILNAAVNADNKTIEVSPTKDCVPGIYYIIAKAVTGGSMLASTAKTSVTIVRGIHDLEVRVPTQSMYKGFGKTAAIQPSIAYNATTTYDGTTTKLEQPKTKKVIWSITDEKGEALADDHNIMIMKNAGHLSFNASTGKVTINTGYKLKDSENSFYLTATAFDYTRNSENLVKDVSRQITITEALTKINALAIVKEGEGKWEVLAKSAAATTPTKEASVLHGTMLVALTEALGNETALNKDDERIIPTSNVAFASTYSRNVQINKDGVISVIAPAPTTTIKLSAALTDGSSSAKTYLSIKADYDSTTDLKLEVEQFKGTYKAEGDRDYIKQTFAQDAAAVNKWKLEYNGGNTFFKLTVKDSNKAAPDFANYAVTAISGAKIISKDGNNIYVAATAKDAKISLTDKAKPKATGITTYTLTNLDMLAGSKDPEAPTLAKRKAFYEKGKKSEQIAEIKVSNFEKWKKNNKLIQTGDVIQAYVELDWSRETASNKKALKEIASRINLGILDVGDDDVIKLVPLDTLSANTINLTPGKYYFKVTFGKMTDGKFAPVARPKSIEMTVDAAKAFTFTPVTSYTIDVKKGGSSALLDYSKSTRVTPIENLNLEWEDSLQNANSSGLPNKVREYFELVDSNGDGKKDTIQMTDAAKSNLADAAKNNTGYITYKVTPKVGYYKNEEIYNTVKITITLKTK